MAEMKSMAEGEVLPILYGVHVGQPVEDEETLRTNTDHWHAEYSQYLSKGILPPRLSHPERQKFLSELKFYSWEDPNLYKKCANGIVRRCAMEFQMEKILQHCHLLQTDGHNGAVRTASRVLQSGFYWPTLYEDAHNFVSNCETCQKTGILERRIMKPFAWVNELDAFDVWEVSMIGPLQVSDHKEFILIAVDYTSKWAEVTALSDRDFFRIERFLDKHVLRRFGTPLMLISDGSMEF